MYNPYRLSRMERRRAEEAQRRSRSAWRILSSFLLMALAFSLVVRYSFAWFTNSASVGAAITTGTWESLMDPDAPGPLTIVNGASSGSITTTNTSNYDLYFKAEWAPGTIGGQTITVVDTNTNQTLVGGQGTLPKGHTAQITVSGSWSDSWSGNLLLSIGTNYYDEKRPAVSVQVFKVPDIVTITGVCFFGSGTAAPQNRWVEVLTASAKANLPPSLQNQTLVVTRTGVANYLNDSTQMENPAIKASLTEPTAAPNSNMSTDTWVNQANMKIWSGAAMTPKYYPTTVELTVTAQNPSITGAMKVYYVMGQSSDINAITRAGYPCPTNLTTFEIGSGNKVIAHPPGEVKPASLLGATSLTGELQTDGALPPTSNEMQTPAGGEVQTPAGAEAQPPAGAEAQPPAGDEVQPPAGDEVQPPASDEVQPPAGDEVQPPAGDEAQPPADDKIPPPTSPEKPALIGKDETDPSGEQSSDAAGDPSLDGAATQTDEQGSDSSPSSQQVGDTPADE